MAAVPERVTRVSEELFQAAAVAGLAEHRSAKSQLERWARIGQSVDVQTSSPRRRVQAVMAGRLPLTQLTAEEGVVFDAVVETDLAERIAATDLGATLRAEGVTTVSLDADGRLVEQHPDGTRHALPGTTAKRARRRSA